MINVVERLNDDFVAAFNTPESRKSSMFRLFAMGCPIEGIDRDDPRIVELLRLYQEENK